MSDDAPGDDQQELLDQVAEEYAERLRAGEDPDIAPTLDAGERRRGLVRDPLPGDRGITTGEGQAHLL